MTTASAPAASACRPALADPRLDFISKAEGFARENAGQRAFGFLRRFLRCSEDELAAVMAKIYCESLPESFGESESLAVSCAKLVLFPLSLLASKKLVRGAEPAIEWDVEVADARHFERRFARIFARLPAPKRLSPSAVPCAFPGQPAVDPVMTAIAPRSLLFSFVLPALAPALWLLSRRYRLNLALPFRTAVWTYAVFDGHFRRYPCRNFLSYDDVVNHPCRLLAFRQNGGRRFAVTQNGQRAYHPKHAFGAVDLYLSFGSYLQKLAPELRIKAREIVPVGCLNLDEWRTLVSELEVGPREALYDVLLLDQGVSPRNGLDAKTGAAFERLFGHLGELKRRKPALRIAVQLRPYGGDETHRRLARAAYARFCGPEIAVLENAAPGDSYRSIFRARLVLCFNSTLGYESFFVGRGKKALFVNFANNPFAVFSADERFQLYDPQARYEDFERKVEELLALELDEPPAVAREQIAAFDGRAQERIADALCAEPSR